MCPLSLIFNLCSFDYFHAKRLVTDIFGIWRKTCLGQAPEGKELRLLSVSALPFATWLVSPVFPDFRSTLGPHTLKGGKYHA
jgi:hypothetical protein